MKISELKKILNAAQKAFGDVPVKIIDADSGYYLNLKQVYKIHPYTAQYGCLNRNEPVNGIVLSSDTCNAPDLVLNK